MPFTPSSLLLSALILMESGNNPLARKTDRFGYEHLGVLQIENRVVKDVNKYLQDQGGPRRTFLHKDCYKRDTSIRVFCLYCQRYADRVTCDREAALLLRYGPLGMRKAGADGKAYWLRVEATMEGMGASATP